MNQLLSEEYSSAVNLPRPMYGSSMDGVGISKITYTYDARGNMLRKVYTWSGGDIDYPETMTYADTVWNDRVTKIGNTTISYDEIGNPLNWTDNATLTWQHGRQLASFTRGDTSISYTYNDEGIRTSKTIGDVTTTYNILDGGLRSMTDGTNTLQFFEKSVYFNNVEYWYVYNAQNDVIGLIDNTGEYVVRYTYSAYGLPLSKTGSMADTLGALNPYRYRGYIYDEETGFYYVSSRYYDPAVGRFLNSDTEALVTATPEVPHWDKNLYAYCDNNPIMREDAGGEFWNYVIGGVVGAVVGGVSAAISGGDWKAIALGAGVGAIGGLLAASGIPAVFQIAAGGLLSGANNLATQTLVEGKSLQEVDWIDVGIDTAIGAGTSALSYGVTRNASKAADKIICKGANKVVKGQQSLLSGSRYGKGAIKKGTAIMNSGIKQMNTVRGTSSVVGSTSGGFLTSVKSFFKRLFR